MTADPDLHRQQKAPATPTTCDPAANTKHEHWNTTGTEENCGAVAIGGGGGVASGDGTIYFLSPELLDGTANGVKNAPNLYVARPGQAPHFVATLESSANAPLPPPAHPFLRSFGSFIKPAGVAIDHSCAAQKPPLTESTTPKCSNSTPPTATFTSPTPQYNVVQKFDSSGHPITSWGTNGQLEALPRPTVPSARLRVAVDSMETSTSRFHQRAGVRV